MARYLVVANQTLGGSALETVVRSRIHTEREGPVATEPELHIVVPATAPSDQQVPVEGDAISIAERRLQEAIKRLQTVGASVTGEVGSGDPMQAISDALGAQSGYVEIIISTLPSGPSKWLRSDLPHRAERRFGLRVTTIESKSEFD